MAAPVRTKGGAGSWETGSSAAPEVYPAPRKPVKTSRIIGGCGSFGPMYTVTETVYFCYGHRLLEYEGKCVHMHGHNGKVEIELEADALDRLGMVVDFSDIGEAMKSWIDANLDHRMLLREDDPLCEVLRKMGEPLYTMPVNPTAEAIARVIFDQAVGRKFPVREVRLWETESSVASYSRESRRA